MNDVDKNGKFLCAVHLIDFNSEDTSREQRFKGAFFIIVNADGSFDVEKGIVQVENTDDYLEQLNAFKELNGWDKRYLHETFEKETEELVRVTYDGDTITTTLTHPFYVPQKGWTSAIELRAGDMLVTVNGEYVVVEKIQHELLETPVTVYNFEVEDFYTYYVSADAINDGVLVHNRCGDYKKYNAKEMDCMFDLKEGTFHRNIKPKIKTYMRQVLNSEQLNRIGGNPDIMLRKSDYYIKLITSPKNIPKFSVDLGISILEFLKKAVFERRYKLRACLLRWNIVMHDFAHYSA